MFSRVSVYFIVSCGNPMMIKIGRAKNPLKRLAALQVGNGNRLELVGVLDCKSPAHALEEEKKAHKRFSENHVRGEWFRYHKSMVWEISKWIRRRSGHTQTGEITDISSKDAHSLNIDKNSLKKQLTRT